MSIQIVNLMPSIFKHVSASGKSISEIKNPRFYFSGGGNVVAVRFMESDVIEVYVPRTAYNRQQEVLDALRKIKDVLVDSYTANGFQLSEWFLFDIYKKQAVLASNFSSNFTPAYQTKRSIFISGSDISKVYLLTDELDITDLQFTAAMFARFRLMRGPVGQDWQTTGKALLSYIISKRFEKPGTFTSYSGCWDWVDYNFPEEDSVYPDLDPKALKVGRAMELAAKVSSAPLATLPDKNSTKSSSEETTGSSSPVRGGPKGFSLQELVNYGITKWMQERKSIGGRYSVDIDICSSVFKKIVIDASIQIVEVNLHSSVSGVTFDDITEMLGTEYVSVDDEISLQIISQSEFPGMGQMLY